MEVMGVMKALRWRKFRKLDITIPDQGTCNMLNDNKFTKDQLDAIFEARTRHVASLRAIMLTERADLPPSETDWFLFTAGEDFNFETIEFLTNAGRELSCDVVYLEFGPDQATARPQSIHLILVRDPFTHIVRNCDIWMDHNRRRVALIPPAGQLGYFVCEDAELVHLPNRPSKVLTNGLQRATKAWRTRARAVSLEEARHSFDLNLRSAA